MADSSVPPYLPPPDHDCIRVVTSFAALLATPFADGVNALVWPRALPGDFAAIVAALGPLDDITPLDEPALAALNLGPAGRAARTVLIDDLRRLRAHGLDPSLDCIPQYPRDDYGGPVPTDVYSFHADSAPVPADTYLCSYTTAASEGLRPADAIRCVDLPDLRAALLREFGGADDDTFQSYLTENCFDLHYRARPGARPYSFGFGHLWRIATAHPGCPVPPCVHRAPATHPGQPPRLLLIS